MENPKCREVQEKVLAAHFSKVGTAPCLGSGQSKFVSGIAVPIDGGFNVFSGT
ncbi:hypothetical protein AB1A65_09130 [Muricauda sp. ANG21]|uniref:hypothetical protein n=1 Tax=Allomuricauda sp. ANG21 TaxID=3042468 RepID=UPI003451B526